MAAKPESTHFQHAMTRYDFTMASMGGVIGSGWLFGVMYSANYAGPASIFAWIIGGVLMLVMALTFAELSSTVPEAGGIIRFPHMSHGGVVSATAAWALWLGYAMTAPIEAEAVIQYAAGYIPGLYAGGNLTPIGLLLAAILVLVFFILNYYGVRTFAKTNTVVTTVKFIVPILTMIALLVAGFAGIGGAGGGANFSAGGGFMPFGFHGVLVAVSIGGIVFAYSGFRQSLDLAAEGKDPQRDVPRAIATVLIFALGLYVLLQVAYIVALTHPQIAKGWGHINFSSPFAQLAAALNLGWLALLLYGDSIISPGGTGLVFTGTQSRVLYAIPKNGYGPKGLLKLNDRGIPINGQIVALVIGLLGLLPFPSWGALVGILSSSAAITYALGGSSLGVLRRTAADLPRKFTLGKQANWIAPAGFAIGALLFYWSGWPLVWQVDLVMFVGLLIYLYYHNVNKLPARDLRAGAWWLVFLAFLLVMSYLGSFGNSLKVIAFPWDSLIVAAAAVATYYWSVASGYETQALKDFRNGVDRDYEGEASAD